MFTPHRLRGLGLFCLGFATALALALGALSVRDSRASDAITGCIPQNLEYRATDGGSIEEFDVVYQIPGCFLSNGYHATACRLAANTIYVTYKKQ